MFFGIDAAPGPWVRGSVDAVDEDPLDGRGGLLFGS